LSITAGETHGVREKRVTMLGVQNTEQLVVVGHASLPSRYLLTRIPSQSGSR
jgi:hypothetical protein